LEGRTSLAIIGGIIEPGEDPEHAARREVYEEMNGLECKQFHFLGRYRTDVNRGMGWLNSFLATDCSRDQLKKNDSKSSNRQLRSPKSDDGTEEGEAEEVGVADTEKQRLKSITLSEFRQAARDGQFLEVQWTATVAQALLHPELAGDSSS
jgi:ADP-ribose pyrophosphatase YjhB (NUDIX family)